MIEIPISPLVRCTLFVRSLERSCAFYQGLLGLAEVHLAPTQFAGTAASRLLGLPPQHSIRGTILKSPGPNFGMLGIFEIGAGAETLPASQSAGIRIGEAALVFYRPGLRQIIAHVERFGARVVAGPVSLQRKRPVWAGCAVRLSAFGDDEASCGVPSPG